MRECFSIVAAHLLFLHSSGPESDNLIIPHGKKNESQGREPANASDHQVHKTENEGTVVCDEV